MGRQTKDSKSAATAPVVDPEVVDPASDAAVDQDVDTDDLDTDSPDDYEREALAMLPPEEQALPGAFLFINACVMYGINPDPKKLPPEIMRLDNGRRWRFYPGDSYAVPPVPDRVVFVTHGGLKISAPPTPEFDEALHKWFRTDRQDPKTLEVVRMPLPASLTLPRQAITGVVPKQETLQQTLSERILKAQAVARPGR